MTLLEIQFLNQSVSFCDYRGKLSVLKKLFNGDHRFAFCLCGKNIGNGVLRLL